MSRKAVFLALPALLISVQCVATDESSSASGQKAEPDSTQLNEIVVTAQKRSQSILSVPVAVSAVDSDLLRQMAPKTASDIAIVAPGLQVNTSNGSSLPIFSLRGVTQNDYATTASGPIATYVDEVYPPVATQSASPLVGSKCLT